MRNIAKAIHPFYTQCVLSVFIVLTSVNTLSQESNSLDADLSVLMAKIEALEAKQSKQGDQLYAMSKSNNNNPVSFHGFYSVGLSKLSESDAQYNYITGHSGDLSLLPTSYAGLQINAELYQGGEFVMQVVAKGSNASGTAFELQTEWLYFKQDLGEGFDMQLGRIRFPAFMESDTYYAGISYPWVLPPAEVYGTLPLTHMDGISINHRLDFYDWGLESKLLLWGNADEETVAGRVQLKDASGLILNLANDDLAFRLAYMVAEETLDIDVPVGAKYDTGYGFPEGMQAQWSEDLTYIIGSVKFDNSQLYASAEAVVVTAKDNALDENQNFNITTGWYFGPVLAYIAYSQTKVTNSDELAAGINAKLGSAQMINIDDPQFGPVPTTIGAVNGPFLNRQQSTKMLGIKWDFMPKTSFKAQLQYVGDFDGTGGNFRNTVDSGFEDSYIYDVAIQGMF